MASVSMLEHQPPLKTRSRAADSSSIDSLSLSVVAVENRGLLLLQGSPETIRERTALAVPDPQKISFSGECALLWLAPREYLIELPAAQTSTMQEALCCRLDAVLASVTDVSDAFASFDVGGECAVDVLATGCSLDLSSHAFAAGQVARTILAGVPAIIWRHATSHPFRCVVDRSFAEHFWSWFARAPVQW